MIENEFTLDWLISTHGDFLSQFNIDREKIITGYQPWINSQNDTSVKKYFCELLRQACLYVIKNSNNEEEAYNSKLQLEIKMLEYEAMGKENQNYLMGQIHFDKLMISRLTLPFKFDVQIDSVNCCSYCAKKNKKTFSLEKILEKKYLPFAKCNNENGCSCSYSIIPLYDENGNLLEKGKWY